MRELGFRHAFLAEPRNFLERRLDRGVPALGLDRQRDRERPGDFSRREARVDPVGQPELVAHPHAQPRGQRRLAESRIGEGAGEELRRRTNEVGRLRHHDIGARLVGHQDRLLPGRRLRHANRRQRAAGPSEPVGESVFEAIQNARRLHVADDDQLQRRGAVTIDVEGAQLVARQRFDLRDALLGGAPAKGVALGIDRARGGLEGPVRRLVLLLAYRADEPLLLLLELLRGEDRQAKDLDERVQQHVAIPRERRASDVHAHEVGGIRRQRKRRAAALQRFGNLELGAALGALHHLFGRQGGNEPPVARREEGSGIEAARKRHGRIEVVLEHVEAGPVAERPPVHPLRKARPPFAGGRPGVRRLKPLLPAAGIGPRSGCRPGRWPTRRAARPRP